MVNVGVQKMEGNGAADPEIQATQTASAKIQYLCSSISATTGPAGGNRGEGNDEDLMEWHLSLGFSSLSEDERMGSNKVRDIDGKMIGWSLDDDRSNSDDGDNCCE
jgi:hypothetical protein